MIENNMGVHKHTHTSWELQRGDNQMKGEQRDGEERERTKGQTTRTKLALVLHAIFSILI